MTYALYHHFFLQAMTSTDENGSSGKSGTDKAKELLAKYGSAYLITSISFAIVSFSICYALVNAGEDYVWRTKKWNLS